MKPTLLLPALLLSTTLSQAATLPSTSATRAGFVPERLETLRATVGSFVERGDHAGIITLVARHGRIVDVHAYGMRDRENRLPMERDTICRVYSMSKIITSVAVLCLLEDGVLRLDDPVDRFLPELKQLKVITGGTVEAPQLEPAQRPITLRHLLTHTSGLTYDFAGQSPIHLLYKNADLWSGPDLQDFIRKVATLPLQHHPGDQYTYGINTDVLGAVIERASGQRFGAFLESRLFAPLGMVDTGFDVPPEKLPRLAKTYQHGPDGRGLVEAEPMLGTHAAASRGIESGGAGLFSTVDDYARFAQMLCQGGTLEGHRILGRKTVELMTRNHLALLPAKTEPDRRAKGFGLGVEVTLDAGRGGVPASPGQFGWYGAATTYCQIDPKENLVAIAFAQHFPFNQHDFFDYWATAYYQALR
ncbi:MAG: beta-lactamase family protein [Verrucomicrobiales bacterium]|nr:beta-lactamase family protein [Verrucomicrobiales bacterium]